MKISKIKSIILFLAAIVAIPGFYIQYRQYAENHGGEIKMSIMNNLLNNNDSRSIFICICDSSQDLTEISIAPIYENSSEYLIKDFDLSYNVDFADGNAPKSNDFYKEVKLSSNTSHYRYSENTLSQGSYTIPPFQLSDLPLKDSRYIIKSKASYPGATNPYIYTVNLWLKFIPKYDGQSLEDWELTCKNFIYKSPHNSGSYDAFYCADGKYRHEFGIDFGSVTSKQLSAESSKPKPKGNTVSTSSVQNIKQEKERDSIIGPVDDVFEISKQKCYKKKDGKLYGLLILKNNQILKKDSTYIGVLHSASRVLDVFPDRRHFYTAVDFKGTGNDSVEIKRIYDTSDYVEAAKLDTTLMDQLILYSDGKGLYVKSKSFNSSFVLRYYDKLAKETYSTVVTWYPKRICVGKDTSNIIPIGTYSFKGLPFFKNFGTKILNILFHIFTFFVYTCFFCILFTLIVFPLSQILISLFNIDRSENFFMNLTFYLSIFSSVGVFVYYFLIGYDPLLYL